MKNILLLMVAGLGLAQTQEVPIACNLGALTAAQRKELSRLGGQGVAAVVGSKELPDGYSFRLDTVKQSLTDIAQWVDLWRRCCPFYEFQVDVHGADGSTWLSLRGRKGVKEYFPIDAPKLAAKLK
jgi:hypothetical protein